jgi:hypothetical protein
VDGLDSSASAVLYSAQSLGIPADQAEVTLCRSGDPAYRFRYARLFLLLQAGDQYVLLPQSWTRQTGSAFVVPRSDAVRLDFRPGGAAEAPLPAC